MRVAVAAAGRFHVLDLARELSRLGHEVLFYSYVPARRAAAFGFPPHRTRGLLAAVWPRLLLNRLLRGARRERNRLRVAEALDRAVARWLEPCDVLIAMSGLYVEALDAARARYGAQVLLERGNTHVLEQARLLGEDKTASTDPGVARELRGYAAADVIVVPSRHAEAGFRERGVTPERLFRNPYGVDVELFRPTPAPPADIPTLLFVGSWCRRKGADLLEGAVRRMAGVRLRHVGPIGDLPFPRDPRFVHHAPVDQRRLPAVYAGAHGLALPSREDGFGLVLTQALACGLPVVASDRTGGPDLRETLPDPTFVTVVPAGEEAPLTAGLETALSKALRLTGPRDGLGEARREWSWGGYGRRYGRFLKSVRGGDAE